MIYFNTKIIKIGEVILPFDISFKEFNAEYKDVFQEVLKGEYVFKEVLTEKETEIKCYFLPSAKYPIIKFTEKFTENNEVANISNDKTTVDGCLSQLVRYSPKEVEEGKYFVETSNNLIEFCEGKKEESITIIIRPKDLADIKI